VNSWKLKEGKMNSMEPSWELEELSESEREYLRMMHSQRQD